MSLCFSEYLNLSIVFCRGCDFFGEATVNLGFLTLTVCTFHSCLYVQVLAINRGESLKILTVKVNIPDRVKSDFTRWCINTRSDASTQTSTYTCISRTSLP